MIANLDTRQDQIVLIQAVVRLKRQLAQEQQLRQEAQHAALAEAACRKQLLHVVHSCLAQMRQAQTDQQSAPPQVRRHLQHAGSR